MDNKNIRSAVDFVNEFADDKTKERFELDDLLYNISMKIFDYRMENKLSQTELAKKLGITQVMVSKLESGQYNPSVEQLWKISKKLGWKLNISIDSRRNEKTEIWDTQEYKLGNIGDNIKLLECS